MWAFDLRQRCWCNIQRRCINAVWCWVLSCVLMTDWYSIRASWSNGIHQVSARASSGLVLSIFTDFPVFFSSPAACKDNFLFSNYAHIQTYPLPPSHIHVCLYIYVVLVWLKHQNMYVACLWLFFSIYVAVWYFLVCGHMVQDSAMCLALQ